ncbi:MAG TPA: type II toxin-antitoxin system PemK/MazF family toxin [Acidimicrobiales bacterium]
MSFLRRTFDRLRGRATPVPSAKSLKISYEPKPDGRADPGEVVWTWVPYADNPRKGKDRPVLVIGRLGRDLAVLALTSKDHTRFDDCIELGPGGWDRSGRSSFVKLDRVLSVTPAKVRREGATLDRNRFDHVVEALKSRRS